MVLLRVIVSMSMMFAVAAFIQAAPVPMESVEVRNKKLEELWTLLLPYDEAVSSRALLELSVRPKADVVKFLSEKLKPIKISKEKLEKLIGALGDDNEKVADAAYTELGYFDPRLEFDLAMIMKITTSKLQKQRMVALMFSQPLEEANKYIWCDVEHSVINNPAAADVKERVKYGFLLKNDSDKPAGFQTELDRTGVAGGVFQYIPSTLVELRLSQWNRATRAIMILELFRTPDAIQALETMATGHPDASPTRAANEALVRLKK